ncbi:MAG: hypothetical protein ACLPX8_26945 [Bryobacteraceae bacterium]|jgi:hypothetical protein
MKLALGLMLAAGAALAAPGPIAFSQSVSALPNGGTVAMKLEPGRYRAEWFSALTGEVVPIGVIDGPAWTSPSAPDANDWALLLQR